MEGKAGSWKSGRKSFRYLGIEREFLRLAALAQDSRPYRMLGIAGSCEMGRPGKLRPILNSLFATGWQGGFRVRKSSPTLSARSRRKDGSQGVFHGGAALNWGVPKQRERSLGHRHLDQLDTSE